MQPIQASLLQKYWLEIQFIGINVFQEDYSFYSILI
jgi:hypothetical protein